MARAPKDPKTGVTPQQERFAAEIVKTGRMVVAYRAAYKAEKMSLEACRVEAWRLLDNPTVALRVEHYRKIATGKLEASVERIALELARIAFVDLGNLYDDDGRPIPLHELDEDTRRALNGMDIEVRAGGVSVLKKYKHIPKVEALRVLAQWRKMLVDRVETGKPGEFDELSDAELEQEAREALAEGVKSGLIKVLPRKPKAA